MWGCKVYLESKHQESVVNSSFAGELVEPQYKKFDAVERLFFSSNYPSD